MALSILDPNSALIVIDLQSGVVAYPTVHPIQPVVARAAALTRAFRRHRLPVALVNVNGFAPGRSEQVRRQGKLPPDWAELVPELDVQPDDILVTKRTWGAFGSSDLATRLTDRGVTQVVIAGVATSIGVESTARQAHELGLHVTLAVDAMTDLNPDAHANSVDRIFPRLGETGRTEDIIALLDRRHA